MLSTSVEYGMLRCCFLPQRIVLAQRFRIPLARFSRGLHVGPIGQVVETHSISDNTPVQYE